MAVEFLLNDERVRAEEHAGTLVLDWLRQRRNLTGTKEGCKEGDCGACSVLVGTLNGDGVRYRPMTSCLMPLGELHGRHLLTIEGLNLPQGALNPVQEAMVERGGSQCGFCTPGFIISMCWYMMQSEDAEPSVEGLNHATSGNLCRCTGYGSIRRAGDDLSTRFGAGGADADVWAAPDRIAALVERGLLPAYLTSIPQQLTALDAELDAASAEDDAGAPLFLAGGTDLYVQRGEQIPMMDAASIVVLNRKPELEFLEIADGVVRLGPLTTFETFASDPGIQAQWPTIKEDMALIASLPIRNRASIAGNLINASPIGDMTAIMLALGAEVMLEGPDGAQRALPLEDLYLGYKTLAKTPEELVAALSFPVVGDGEHVSFEKVSKRRWLDIATVNSAARIAVDADGVVTAARLTLGGVAATPLLLRDASASLVGKPVSAESVREMLLVADAEIAPISDVRGSAQYKRLLARQLLLAHFDRLFPAQVALDQVLGPQLSSTTHEAH